MISIDEILSILRLLKGDSDDLFNNPATGDAHAFGYARGFRRAVDEFDTRLQNRIEELSRSLNEDPQ